MTYVSAWYCLDAAAVTGMTAIGANGFFVPALTTTQIDGALAAMSADQIVVLDLSFYGNHYTDPNAVQDAVSFVEHYANTPKVAGFLLFDEPNNGGQSDAVALQVQKDWYTACKQRAPDKLVYVNYAVGPTIPDVGAILTTPRQGWDQVCVDYYPLTWDVTDAQAVSNLTAAASAVRTLFGSTIAIHWFQQAAGCTADPGVAPRLRPISGDLQAQYDILDAAGLMTVSKSLAFYGWGTSPEDQNLHTDAALRTEAAAVIAIHQARHP